jgi:hypothetical protein
MTNRRSFLAAVSALLLPIGFPKPGERLRSGAAGLLDTRADLPSSGRADIDFRRYRGQAARGQASAGAAFQPPVES